MKNAPFHHSGLDHESRKLQKALVFRFRGNDDMEVEMELIKGRKE